MIELSELIHRSLHKKLAAWTICDFFLKDYCLSIPTEELSWDEAKRKVLEEAYDDELKNYKECKSELEKRQAKRRYFKSVKATIDHLGDAVTEFDKRLWCNLLDHIVVNDEERVTVIFRDGMEIVVPLGNLVKSRTRTASREKTTS